MTINRDVEMVVRFVVSKEELYEQEKVEVGRELWLKVLWVRWGRSRVAWMMKTKAGLIATRSGFREDDVRAVGMEIERNIERAVRLSAYAGRGLRIAAPTEWVYERLRECAVDLTRAYGRAVEVARRVPWLWEEVKGEVVGERVVLSVREAWIAVGENLKWLGDTWFMVADELKGLYRRVAVRIEEKERREALEQVMWHLAEGVERAADLGNVEAFFLLKRISEELDEVLRYRDQRAGVDAGIKVGA
ncbi:MAG: hypothetical protein ABGW50_02015 [Thermococcus sp.]